MFWVSVDSYLPALEHEVLVYTRDGIYYLGSLRISRDGGHSEWAIECAHSIEPCIDEVTHWCSLPDKPMPHNTV